MKLVSLRTKRVHRQRKPGKPSRATQESFAKPTPLHHQQIHTYAELRQQIHDDLRIQHPEWVESDGKSPMCDSYDTRLTELLNSVTRREPAQCIVDPHRLLEQGATWPVRCLLSNAVATALCAVLTEAFPASANFPDWKVMP